MKRNLLIFAILFLNTSIFSQIPNDPLLIAFYPFDGNGNDISLNGFNATLVGPSTFTTDRFGNPGKAFSFNGYSNYFLINNTNATFKPTTFPLTVCVWLKIPPGNQGCFTFFKNDFAQDIYSGIRGTVIPNGTITISLENGGPIGPQSRNTKTGTTNIEDGKWHLITCIIRGFNNMDIYVDCRNDYGDYSGDANYLFYDQNNSGIIGAYDGLIGNTGLDYSLGVIDQLFFIKRELSVQEILGLYFNTPVTISGSDTICPGLPLTLSASGGNTYLWSSGQTTANATVYPSVTTTYTVTATDANNCSQTNNTVVYVYPNPIANAGPDQIISVGESVMLNGSGGQTYTWHPSNTLSNPYIANPIATPSITTTYNLTVTNNFGCSASDNVTIFVEPGNNNDTTDEKYSEIFVPNIFSPNGDGENDIVYVYGTNIKAIKFYIYNRWGEKIFESTNQTIGWNGSFKGEACQIDVYVYYLEAYLLNGNKIKRKGNISLVR